MKAQRYCALAMVLWLGGVAGAQSGESGRSSHDAAKEAREKLIGAWRLVSMEEPGADGKLHHITDRKGMLIYTRDGHMSVQLMYPKSAGAPSNQYVSNGYEASFGSYDVDEATHTLTHHVEGSVTGDLLVGKDLPRVYRFTDDGRLIIRSARPDERWSVTWEHF